MASDDTTDRDPETLRQQLSVGQGPQTGTGAPAQQEMSAVKTGAGATTPPADSTASAATTAACDVKEVEATKIESRELAALITAGVLANLWAPSVADQIGGLDSLRRWYAFQTSPQTSRLWPRLRHSPIDQNTATQLRQLEGQITTLKTKLDDQTRQVQVENLASAEKTKRIGDLEATLAELQSSQSLKFLLDRVNTSAQQALLNSEALRAKFLERAECDAFVISIDIRRSTDLMLKARTPEKFAAFITGLCSDLMNIVTDSFGVFDKFTGDGILAFFPDFYSGEDAGALAISAAMRCHEAFKRHYRNCRSSFSSVLTDVGLGIGIDYGKTHLVQMAGGLTVVGVPVVYACRLGGAPPGCTYLNQPAFEKVCERANTAYFLSEVTLDIKHEGSILAYSVKPGGVSFTPKTPGWLSPPESTPVQAAGKPAAEHPRESLTKRNEHGTPPEGTEGRAGRESS